MMAAYAEQSRFINEIKKRNDEIFDQTGRRPSALTKVYGCQQNEADGERLRGLLAVMGYDGAEDIEQADIVVLNTCAVREHAEKRVLGHIGAMPRGKIFAVCGCMAQQEKMQEKIKKSYPQVNLMFGPALLPKLPEMLFEVLAKGGRRFYKGDPTAPIEEWLPAKRNPPPRGWVTVMTGCDNFCSYCVVPYVRGRERSRDPEEILAEVRELLNTGYTEIFLLGQNVNSYAPKSSEIRDFPSLLTAINDIEGDFTIRFMTSHPKDAGTGLLETMARCEKVARTLHLPFQSGSDSILEAMNRKYTHEEYVALASLSRETIPGVTLTSDVIVGFPGETDEDFERTLELIRKVRFAGLYTFIYSPRDGTPAAGMPDDTPITVKKQRFEKLLAVQKEIETYGHADDAAISADKGSES